MYDLDLLNYNITVPHEFQNYFNNQKKNILFTFSGSNAWKNMNETIEYLKSSSRSRDYNFIILGKSDISNEPELLSISRKLNDSELLGIMSVSNIISCYYNNNRPSGF